LNVLLSGIVGSTAYGLAHEGSDIDVLGVFATRTNDLLGLRQPSDSVVTKDPDTTFHEAKKFCRLVLNGNPSVTEALWLPEELYQTRTALGDELIGIRSAFLSATRIRSAYFGYAVSQFERLRKRGDGTFSPDTAKRTAKHARHMYRLLHQGFELWSTGNLTVQVSDPAACREFGERIESGEVSLAEATLLSFGERFDNTACVLPDESDETPIEDWLQRVRKHCYN
jgi:predicted nucleotidyltransferase